MGLRDKLIQKPAVTASIAVVALVFAAILIYHQTLGRPRRNVKLMNSAFYSDDDGKTFFIDDDTKLPPFLHDEKIAVRAAVYRAADGKLFVAYLQKFSDAQLNEIEAAIAAHPEEADHWRQSRTEVKKPGDSKWLSWGSYKEPKKAAAYQQAMTPVSPDGSTNVSPVSPGDPDAVLLER
jgi:hypothetical protein